MYLISHFVISRFLPHLSSQVVTGSRLMHPIGCKGTKKIEICKFVNKKCSRKYNFEGEKSKNHRDAIPNNEQTERKRHIDMPRIDARVRFTLGPPFIGR